ncbi:MAG: lipoprotein [Rhodobacteraceae bacterium]|nr:MAG: lipoprotein [Paracoccaceae bacterium]
MQRRTLLLGLATLPLGACAGTPAPPTTSGPPITLVSAFRGRTTGRGLFRIWLTGSERRFTARLNGTVTGHDGARKLTVVEDFLYDDGQKDRLTWVFNEISPGRWTGKREDTVGQAVVIEEDGRIRLSYTADFKSPSGVNRLGFEDILYAEADGTVINDAVVSRAGIPVASVRFVIRR